MDVYTLDGAEMTTREAAHAHIAKALGFPEYYGGNLDALADCLSELGPGSCVALVNLSDAEKNLGPYARRLLGVFEDCAAAPGAFSWVVCAE